MIDVTEIKDGFANFKGKQFRDGQEEAITRILDSDRKVVVVCAPTGSGKSLIGMVAGAHHKKACYLCSSKQLQRQLVHDFPEAMAMMGRGNFPCNQDPTHRTAEMCIHTSSTPCSMKFECHYERHKREVLIHPLQILNYHYFLTEANYVGRFSDYPIIVCDEGDVLEGLLTGFIELRLSKSRLDALRLDPPRYRTSTAKAGLSSWREWARDEGKHKVKRRIDEIKQRISHLRPSDRFTDYETKLVGELHSLENLVAKLAIFTEHLSGTWIFQEQYREGNVDAWSFQPTWLSPELSRQYLFQHGQRFVFMSATFPPKAVLAEMMGLSTGDIEYLEIPSAFPVDNRPVLLNPVADMSYRTFRDGLPTLLGEIERILDKHPHEKGIIHTVSWRLNDAVMRMGNPRLISHNGTAKDQELKRFMDSTNGVFVSPSSSRGVDLPDELCRFVIIAKAPFQSLGDKLVSSRVHGSGMGGFWYRAICAQDIVQASGRGVRHAGDHCVTYLLDKQIEKLVVDNQNLFPRYWMEAVDYA